MTALRATPLLLVPLLLTGCDEGATAPIEPSDFPVPAVSTVGSIAFASDRDGAGPWIYVVNPDGTGLRKLVRGEGPAWSPDGRSLSFHRNSESLVGSELVVVGANGGGERVVAHGGTNPSWSPDGTRIAFDRGNEVHVVNPDGTGDEVLVGASDLRDWLSPGDPDFFATASGAAWSRDGSLVAVTVTGPWDAPRILLLAADGSGPPWDQRLPDGDYADFSPDGKLLVVSLASRITIVSIDFQTTDRTLPFQGSRPRWSADGTNIVYHDPPTWFCGAWGPCETRLFLVDPSNMTRQRVVPEAASAGPYADYDPAWSSGAN